MEIDVITLFPALLRAVLDESVLSRAIAKGVLAVHLHQLRDHATDKHHAVDAQPFGGGAGMVMKPDVLERAWQAAQDRRPELPMHTILLSPQGAPLAQRALEGWAGTAAEKRLLLVCGRYEGVDERFIEKYVDEEVSLGDFVLSGGELGALAIIDGVMRLLPGALGNDASTKDESFSRQKSGLRLLEYAQYTRPAKFADQDVPEVLLSGDHKRITEWRRQSAWQRTMAKRPDLLLPGASRPK